MTTGLHWWYIYHSGRCKEGTAKLTVAMNVTVNVTPARQIQNAFGRNSAEGEAEGGACTITYWGVHVGIYLSFLNL